MRTSVERIQSDFDAFRRRVESYREVCASNEPQKDSCEAAYDGLYRLNQRIKKEIKSGDLNNQVKAICHELLNDKFLNGLLELRTISAHIVSDTAKKRGHLQIYAPSGQPVILSCEVSAGAAFVNKVFKIPEAHSGTGQISHLDNFNAALKRIGAKFGFNT